ncbi:hypothetical protein EVAR_52081_1 [Eumeta japonica]|uniref:Uncharacterized protein n=1 Tax=Eumeta variegata TaxID=151549 RepID=A0A4C1Y3N7_EUMVA|nr:hypothetical protein EVAR_52081_1 [Eumeta japonica]
MDGNNAFLRVSFAMATYVKLSMASRHHTRSGNEFLEALYDVSRTEGTHTVITGAHKRSGGAGGGGAPLGRLWWGRVY